MSASAGPRLALIELLLQERWRHFRNELFPFVQGHCRALGVPARRLRVVVSPGDVGPGSAYQLPPADRASLVAAFCDLAPTHLVLTERLAPATAAALSEAAPGAAWLKLGELEPSDPTPLDRPGALARWLGVPWSTPGPDPLLVDAAEPLYEIAPVHDLARRERVLVNVVSGPECHYARRVARVACFADLPLDARSRAYGCTFCGAREIELPRPATPLLDLALAQIVRAAATPDPHGLLRAFLVPGAFVADRLPELLARLVQAGLPPVEVHVICRIDQLLAAAAGLEGGLPAFAGAGHRLRLGPMGVENFSSAENERFNKGVTAEQAVAAHELLARLGRAWPDAIASSSSNTFGLILFTPWTTLDDLRTNLAWAPRAGIDPANEIFLATRLRLRPYEPITLLAERAGLLAPGEGRGQFGHARLRERDELPWRYAHPEVGLAEQVLSRFPSLGGEGPDDELYTEVQRWMAELARRPERVYAAANAVLDEVAADPGAEAPAVVRRARGRCV